MRKPRLLFILTASIIAILMTCSLSFASQAVVDSHFDDYEHQPRFDDCIVIDGIDVSAWQDEIHWNKVKKNGIDYALIRVGYTGLDSPFGTHKDSCFEANYKSAREAGVLVGVYYYSCATTVEEAEKEAKYVLSILDNRELDLPVVFDFEYAGRIKEKYTNKKNTTSNILAFLSYIEEHSDYEAMLYSYRNIMDPDWNQKFYIDKVDHQYPVWIAQYSSDFNIHSYSRPFAFWQYTSSGTVSGINGNVDCNFWYFNEANYPAVEGKLSVKDSQISLSSSSYNYSGYENKPSVSVSYGDMPLTEGKDYKKFYIKNVNAGTSYVMVQGKGDYSGTTMREFTINQIDLANDCEISEPENQTYTASKLYPPVTITYGGTTLKKNIDYSVSYKNNLNAGTATMTIKGKRNFTGTVTKTFKIENKDLKNVTPKLSYSVMSYTGKERRPKVTLDGLTEGVDFTVKYINNTKVGTATVRVTGIGSCYGETEAKFTIRLSAPQKVSTNLRKHKSKGYNDIKVTWNKVPGATSYRVYYKASTSSTWKYKKVSGGSTTSKILYDFSSGKKYNFKVVACCSKGNSKDSAVVSRTTLKKVAQNSVKLYSRSKSKIKVRWSNIAGETGYEISKSTRKSGTNVVATVKSTSASSKVLTVKKGKTYYYKVRAYKLVDGIRVYGPWSAVKSYKLK